MPTFSAYAVRLSTLYLLLGFVLGGLLLTDKAVDYSSDIQRLTPLHAEVTLIGWVLHLAIGVSYWIMPRFGQQRGREWLAWAGLLLLNAGIWVFSGGEVFRLSGGVGLAGRALEVAGAAGYVAHLWPRLRHIAFPHALSKTQPPSTAS